MSANGTGAVAVPPIILIGEVLLVGAEGAGMLIGVSGRQWYRLDAEGLVPPAVVIGNQRRWSMSVLRAWAASGAPSRERWAAMT